jgi:hypothetical protein
VHAKGVKLIVPLSRSQVDGARQLRESLPEWSQADATLAMLRIRFPPEDVISCSITAIVLNQLYSTRVLAINQMGAWIHKVLQQKTATTPVEIVECIASLQLATRRTDTRIIRFTSFASKWCHFFRSEEAFPIYDEAARETLKEHFGCALAPQDEHRYGTFCTYFDLLKSSVQCTTKELDYYLWITGMFLRWTSGTSASTHVNKELLGVFEDPVRRRLLEPLLPTHIAARLGDIARFSPS